MLEQEVTRPLETETAPSYPELLEDKLITPDPKEKREIKDLEANLRAQIPSSSGGENKAPTAAARPTMGWWESWLDRMVRPSNYDGEKIMARWVLPMATAMIGSGIVLGPFTKPTLALWGMTAIGALWGTFAQILEKRQRSYYGDLLTVSPVAQRASDEVVQIFPHLAQETYYGELHLVGNETRPKEIDNPIWVTREAYRGLAALAEACKTKQLEVADLNYFVGISSLFDKRLERMGFEVKEYTEQRLAMVDRVFTPLARGLNRLILRAEGIRPPARKAMVGLISREQLIAYAPLFRRYAGEKQGGNQSLG